MNTKLGVLIVVVLSAAVIVAVSQQLQQQKAQAATSSALRCPCPKAPIATSGDQNVYVAWWTNKTGNDEVMFKASTDGGKTFSDKMNLSNSTNAQSQDVQIAGAGSNVYVSWWERNQTSNEPVMKVSNDNGKTFGDMIELSNNITLPKQYIQTNITPLVVEATVMTL